MDEPLALPKEWAEAHCPQCHHMNMRRWVNAPYECPKCGTRYTVHATDHWDEWGIREFRTQRWPTPPPTYLPFLFDCLDCERSFPFTETGCGGTVKVEDRVQGWLCHPCFEHRQEQAS